MTTRALFFGDSPHRIGGAQKSLLAALERIGEHGVAPALVFPDAGPYEALCRARGLEVHVVPAGEAFRTFGKKLLGLSRVELARVMLTDVARMARDLARLADRLGAEVLHYNTPRGIVMAGAAASLAGLPAVLHVRGWPPLARPVWLAAQLLGDRFVLVARRLLDALEPSALRRATVVYNGIAPAPRVPREAARAELAAQGLDPATPWVLSLSAPVPFKGLHHLLEAAARVARRRRVTWILAGEGLGDDYEAWLRRRAVELGLDAAVRFVGHVDDVTRWLCAADLFVLTSVAGETVRYDGKELRVSGEEGLPRSILESLAAGTPVVTTASGGVREQIDEGITGLVIPPGDPISLAAAVEQVLGDPSWGARAQEVGPRVVAERFSVDGAARGLADALRAVPHRALGWQRLVSAGGLAIDTLRRATREAS